MKPFSLSLSGSSATREAPKKPSQAPEKRRPRQLPHEDESDEGGEEGAPIAEEVTGFDTQTGSVITADDSRAGKKREMVIPVASTNNWRDRPGVNIRRPRGKKNLLPREVQALQEAERSGKVDEPVETEGPSLSYGISYAKPSSTTAEQVGGTEASGDQQAQGAEKEKPLLPPTHHTEEQRQPTQDEIALQALVRESKGDVERRTDLVIESGKKEPLDGEEDEDEDVRYDETSSFRTDVASRPESATLDAYNNIPVEEFGAALLRGMGWKEGQPVGRGRYNASAPSDHAQTPRVPQRRPGFLGIGAKDLSGSKGAEAEIGAWGKAAMRKSSKKSGGKEDGGSSNTDGVYMPVLMKNKKTGEYMTEEELADLQKESKRRQVENDWKERRDRNLERSGRDRDRDGSRDRSHHHRERRRRDYYDDYDDDDNRRERRRHGSSRRDRSLSSGSRYSRRRRYDDEDVDGPDDRYYRERDREKYRDRDRDRSHRHRDDDRYSSRHSSSRHGRDRDRDRDSGRDSHRRRRDY